MRGVSCDVSETLREKNEWSGKSLLSQSVKTLPDPPACSGSLNIHKARLAGVLYVTIS